MIDPCVENMARTLVEYSLGVQKGDRVAVSGSEATALLMKEIGRWVLRAGGQPIMQPRLAGWNFIYMSEANEAQLEFVNPIFKMIQEDFECAVEIRGEINSRELANIPSERHVIRRKAMTPVLETYRERSAKGEFRWIITAYPTPGLAQDAEMSQQEFENFVFGATFSDTPDPVAAWRRIHDKQQRWVDWLDGKKEVVVQGPNADLRLSIEGRPFKNSDGHRNMPDGEIFTSPVEDSAQGWYRASYPALHGGKQVIGVELHFESGQVTSASAQRNEEYLHQILAMDEGARRLGEFAIGTNDGIRKFTRNLLFDEKMGGTMHLALGAGFADLGGENESGLHWDIITDMRDGGQILVDGELFYENGRFKI